MDMAYELGLLCSIPEGLTPEALIRDLCSSSNVPLHLGRWRYGESWAGCEATFPSTESRAALQANVGDNVVASVALRGLSEGALADPLRFGAALTITLTGEVDWAAIEALIEAAKRNWQAILYDEVSGFKATIS
jgi:hypothetical protein